MAQKRYFLLEIMYRTAFLSERVDNFAVFVFFLVIGLNYRTSITYITGLSDNIVLGAQINAVLSANDRYVISESGRCYNCRLSV
jgi:hypothetical protein